jgi:hypothetical protein
MSEIVVDNRANLCIADIVATLAAATIDGAPIFDSVGTVNDVASFVRVADPVRVDGKTACGVVEGTIEEARGWNSDERGNVRLPFEIIVRFAHRRRPGEAETVAMQKAKTLLEAAKAALMVDPSRGGNAGMVYWNGDVINGTTVKGTARQLTGRTPNEAFFTAALSGACAWVKLRDE